MSASFDRPSVKGFKEFGPAAGAAPLQDVALKVRIHQRLLDVLNLSMLERASRDGLRSEIRSVVQQMLAEEKRLLTPAQTDQLIEDVLDELLGLGPLEPLLKDD
ncbi:MAG TPA: CpaF family protein, partial [Chloroflexota bacterium]